MNSQFITREFLTIDEASAHVGIAKATLYTWRTRHPERGPKAVKIGGLLRYRLADIDSWIAAQRDRERHEA